MEKEGQGAKLQTFFEKLGQSAAYQEGNGTRFDLDHISFNPTSPLAGKRIAFLGSSVTYGFAAKGVSFVDDLAARDGVVAVKSAISGTTLAGLESDGYLARLKYEFPTDQDYDLFVCQLSTNDNRHGKPLGAITDSHQREGFDTTTTLGALEEVCRYVQVTYHCPLAFYTCLQNDSHHDYEHLINQLYRLQAKWGFAVIDLFHNTGLVASLAAHPHAMLDDVHPTQEGYLKVWLPVFELELTKILAKNNRKVD